MHCQSKKESEIPLFRSLENVGKELASVINLKNLEKGKHLYFNFGGSNDSVISNKMSLTLLISYMSEFEKDGFHTGIYRSTNIRVVKMFEKMGGTLLKEATYEVKGKSYPLFFAVLDLRNPTMQKLLGNWRKEMKKGTFPKL